MMDRRKILGWSAIAATVVLLVVLKRLHIGVTHYNWFLIILLAWTMGLIWWFRWLRPPSKAGEET